MDPNVQVAIATVIGTTITTLGIVAVALISRPKKDGDDEEDKKEENASEDPQNLELIRSLILENARQNAVIVRQNGEIASLKARLADRVAPKEGP